MTPAPPHPLRCETCNKKGINDCFYDRPKVVKEFINLYGCASHSSATSAEQVLVYSKTIKKSPFKSIKGRELALKDIEDGGYGWTSLVFKLRIGDEIRVYRREKELRQQAGRDGGQG